MGSSIYDVHTEGEGGSRPMWTSKQKIKSRFASDRPLATIWYRSAAFLRDDLRNQNRKLYVKILLGKVQMVKVSIKQFVAYGVIHL